LKTTDYPPSHSSYGGQVADDADGADVILKQKETKTVKKAFRFWLNTVFVYFVIFR
jgi:hypothetical protein